jgi:radical SAM protein with 4Fe4S-binding SPASM domain
MDHEGAVSFIVKNLLHSTHGWHSDHKQKNRSTLLRTVVWYLDRFRDDPAKTLTLDNGNPAVEHSFRFELDWGPQPEQPFLLSGHLDRVVEYNGDLMGMDHKTTSLALTSYYYDQFEPDNQMTLYTLAYRVVFDAPIRGIIINAAQVLVDSTNFGRHFTYRTPDQIEEWLHDLHYWFNLAEHFATENHWPMNDKACRNCHFRQVCARAPCVREAFLEANFEQKEESRWNPLKPR